MLTISNIILVTGSRNKNLIVTTGYPITDVHRQYRVKQQQRNLITETSLMRREYSLHSLPYSITTMLISIMFLSFEEQSRKKSLYQPGNTGQGTQDREHRTGNTGTGNTGTGNTGKQTTGGRRNEALDRQ